MKRSTIVTMFCTGGALIAAGCHRGQPGGQVAATVNGKEVTLQEINTELQASNIPPSADKQTVQRALLQRIIDRKLLAGAAEDKDLDKTPEYLGQKRRADEILLGQVYARQQLAAIPVPSNADIDKFMADRPNAFAKREQLILNQIRFAPPADMKVLEALKDAHSMDAVAATLTRLGIKFQQGNAGLDTASAPTKLIAGIDGLPPTEPFIIPQPGVVTVNVVLQRRPVPLDTAQARPQAAAAWREQKFGELINQQIATLRSGAKIDYQAGFAPPPPPKGVPAAATAPKP